MISDKSITFKIYYIYYFNEESFRVLEGKLLRKILGPVCENEFWRVRHNNESYELFSESDIFKTIKIGRSQWAGHVIRMLDDNPIKKIHPA
jgi:hypothetical protein